MAQAVLDTAPPRFYYWDGVTPTSVGCPVGGGTMRVREPRNDYGFALRRCGFTRLV